MEQKRSWKSCKVNDEVLWPTPPNGPKRWPSSLQRRGIASWLSSLKVINFAGRALLKVSFPTLRTITRFGVSTKELSPFSKRLPKRRQDFSLGKPREVYTRDRSGILTDLFFIIRTDTGESDLTMKSQIAFFVPRELIGLPGFDNGLGGAWIGNWCDFFSFLGLEYHKSRVDHLEIPRSNTSMRWIWWVCQEYRNPPFGAFPVWLLSQPSWWMTKWKS